MSMMIFCIDDNDDDFWRWFTMTMIHENDDDFS